MNTLGHGAAVRDKEDRTLSRISTARCRASERRTRLRQRPWYNRRREGPTHGHAVCGGSRVGTLADAGEVLAEFIAKSESVEFRDESGAVVETFVPTSVTATAEPLVPRDPSMTREELDRRATEPGFPVEEVRKRLG